MTDANQGLSLNETIRRACAFEELDVAWFEEPIHWDDVRAHQLLAASTSVPIAVGEYAVQHFTVQRLLAEGGLLDCAGGCWADWWRSITE